MNHIIVVIPALNPDRKLLDITNELLQNDFKKIIVVNDGSTNDNTVFLDLKQIEGVEVLNHYVNLGKGRALKTAFNHILNSYGDYRGVITVDADGQHKIPDIQKCAESLNMYYSDKKIILGCRQFRNGGKIPLRSRFGNVCTQYVLHYLCNISVSDSQTGLRGIPMHILSRLLKVTGERYEYETNMLLELVELGGAFVEIPIETVYEDNNSASHFNPVKDSLKIYTVIIKYSMASLVSALIDNLIFIMLSMYFSNIYMMTFAGRAVAALFNFTINKKIVFKREGDVLQQSLKYLCLLIMSGSISAMSVSALQSALHLSIIPMRLMVELVLYFFNFYIQKNFIFNKGGKDNANKNQ